MPDHWRKFSYNPQIDDPHLLTKTRNIKIMRIAMTGAAGWIGQRLFKRLAQSGETPLALTGNILESTTFDTGFDCLIHLAGAMQPQFKADFSMALQTNLLGIQRALDACVRNGAGLVFISTSGVYARNARGSLEEKDHLVHPPEPYGQSKWMGEQLCRLYHTRFQVPVRILRLFNVYGPGQTRALLIGYLTEEARANRPIRLKSPHSQRDFIHIDDVVTAIQAAAGRFDGLETLNVGSGRAASVLSVVKLIEEKLARPLDVRMPADHNAGNNDQVTANIDKIDRLLNWKPKIDLAAGIESCLSASWD